MSYHLKLLLIITVIGSSVVGCRNWNRFHQFNCHEIDKLTIRTQYQQDHISQKVIEDTDDICRVLGFLQNAKFSDSFELSKNKPADFLFLFNIDDKHQKAYIFAKTAFIGKTQFGISRRLPRKLDKLYDSLNVPEQTVIPDKKP
ncbi:MAG: hypothetical protein HOI42_12920 [Candidatus Marinimicrobia bacterium]|jgi:hypothetical protein|nr:hypothetical protein [Candidatus Neomarinimicrobiota bacterium]MBT4852831.1 hypothetical protein [Candidatus Neomarinimicrobiota bacterium]MBT6217648.1 hypothetical protein [Candidatus Neomarinimicrobiota bacterium]